ncbi:MAG: ferredoxin [Acidobacteriota bacterium]
MARGELALLFPTFVMRNQAHALDDQCEFVEMRASLERRAAHDGLSASRLRPEWTTPQSLRSPDLVRQAHHATYIESVAAATWAGRRLGPARAAAGYSMGLFAALAHAGVYSVEDGLRLVDAVISAVYAAAAGPAYEIGALRGLAPEVAQDVLARSGGRVEIIDDYAPDVVIVTGRQSEVRVVLKAATHRGAVVLQQIPAVVPFHHSALSEVEVGLRSILNRLDLRPPRLDVVSCLDQRRLCSIDQIRDELARNCWRPMHWFATVQRLSSLGIGRVFECGASASLGNLVTREMPGRFHVLTLRTPADLGTLVPPTDGWYLRVDRERCQGHDRCRAVAPQLFDVDALGQSSVLGTGWLSRSEHAQAELAVANCPEHAITIDQEGVS